MKAPRHNLGCQWFNSFKTWGKEASLLSPAWLRFDNSFWGPLWLSRLWRQGEQCLGSRGLFVFSFLQPKVTIHYSKKHLVNTYFIGEGKIMEHPRWIINSSLLPLKCRLWNAYVLGQIPQKQTLKWRFLCKWFIGKVLLGETKREGESSTEKERIAKEQGCNFRKSLSFLIIFRFSFGV